MTFTEIHNDSNYQILKSWTGAVYENERNYFKVVIKNIASKASFTFNGYTYTGYFNNDSVIIEITDIIRGGGYSFRFDFYDNGSNLIHREEFDSFEGIKQNSITKINLPSEIKVNFSVNAHHNITSTDVFEINNAGVIIETTDDEINTNTIFVIQNREYIKITQIDECKYVLFRWISINGFQKDWFFLQDKLNFSSDKSLQIETGDSDYKQFKNKKISFSVIERMADLSTQKYLSDLVISDDVKVYIDGQWMPVSIETNNVEVYNKRRDLIFNVNFKHYDTI